MLAIAKAIANQSNNFPLGALRGVYFFWDFRFGRGNENLRLFLLSLVVQWRGATSKKGVNSSYQSVSNLVSNLPNGLDLLILLGQTTLGVVAVLVEVGGQALSALLLSLAAL